MGLPSGIVTFLMTDIVGSTPMWERAPAEMDVALVRHDELVDEAVLRHRGHLLRHRGEGDSTFSVFERADDAVAAAVEAQRLIAAERWPDATPVVLRMGLHSGEALIRSGEYHGRVVNRAARVRGSADGGQVLLSGATRRLITDALPDGVTLRFLRMELLRGIDDPEELHEVFDATLPTRAAVFSATDREVATFPPLPAAVAASVPHTFTGRDHLLRRVSDARAEGTRRRFVLLGGEPGAGKTTLAAQAAVAAHDDGWAVLAGSCSEDGDVPYAPVREWLDTAIEHAPRQLLTEHVVAHGPAVGRLSRRLAARLGPLGSDEATDVDSSRRVLVDAVVDLLGRLSAAHPMALLVDDLHWADHNTLQLLEVLARSAVADVLVIATYRDGLADSGAFGGWLERLRRRDDVVDLDVAGFDHAELQGFIAALAGRELGDEDAELTRYVADETGGNPFFVVELLRLLVQQQVVGRGDDGRWRLLAPLDDVTATASVRAVIEERAGRLERRTVELLETAAVAGREFHPDLLARIAGGTTLQVLRDLEPARRASLLRDGSAGRLEFSHALVHHTLYDSLSAAARAAAHVAIAETLDGTAAPALVASHWLRAGDHAAEVVHWARLAGADALQQLAPEDAVRWFSVAVAHATDERSRLDLMIDLGRAQRWGDAASFRGTLLGAAALAQRLGEPHALVRAALANHRGGASRAGEVDAQRVHVLEQALQVVGPAPSAERALLLATIAMERSQGDEIDRSIALADEALAIARLLDDEETLFQVLLRVTEATRIPATLERRLAAAEELFGIAERLDDPVRLGFAAIRDIRTKFEAARFADVDRPFQVLRSVAHADPFVQHNHESLQAVRAQFRGDFTSALAHAERARALGGSEHDALAVYLSTTSMVHWDLGSMGTMLDVLDGVRRQFPGIVGFQPTAALAMVSAGHLDDARAILDDATSRGFGHVPLNPLWAMTISVFASLCIEVGDGHAAALLYDRMSPQRGRANISVVSGNGLVLESLAGLAVAAGRFDRAAADIEAGLRQAHRLALPVTATRLRLAHARLQAAVGEAEGAAATAVAVAREATALGMALVARQAADLAAGRTA